MKAAVIQMFHFCPNKNTIRMYFECKRFPCDHFGNNYDTYALHWRSLFRFWKKNININFKKKEQRISMQSLRKIWIMRVQLFWTLLTIRLSISILVLGRDPVSVHKWNWYEPITRTFWHCDLCSCASLVQIALVRSLRAQPMHISSNCSELVVTFLMPNAFIYFS